MSALQKEIRITISPDNITIAKAANLSRDGKWLKDTIKLEMSIAMIFHKVLNLHRLVDAFEKNDYEILGKMLFKILTTSDDVKKFFMDGLRDILVNEHARCRIYLTFKERVDELATLPWEYLLIEKEDDDKLGAPFYIAADSRLKFDFIRSVEGKDSMLDPTQNKELNIVLIVSDPRMPIGTTVRTPLNSRNLRDMFKKLRVKHEIIHTHEWSDDKPQEDSFVSELKSIISQIQGPYVLHFYGHAKMDNQIAYIAFAKDNGDVCWVSDKELTEMICEIDEEHRPQMIFLQACESGQVGKFAGEENSGLAIRLARQNIPAVIGMQNVVTEVSSTRFAECFYESLLMGDDVAVAVTKGRRQLGCPMGQKSKDYYCDNTFGTPVLFISTAEPVRLLPQKELQDYREKLVDKVCETCRRVFKSVNPETKTRCNVDGCRGNLVPWEEKRPQSVGATVPGTMSGDVSVGTPLGQEPQFTINNPQ